MTTLKIVMVHLDGTKHAATRLAAARDLAHVHRASVTAAFAVAPRFLPLPVPFTDGVPAAPLLDEVDPAHRRHARALYDRELGHTHADARFEDLSDMPPVPAMVRRARLCDVLVLGQPDPSDPSGVDVPRAFVTSVVTGSGTPALIVPFTGTTVAEPKRVLVGWKSSREAARALASSLPLLARAQAVHIAMAADKETTRGDADATSLEAYLHAHGVRNVHFHDDCPDHDAGNMLLSLAAEVKAELLVMGCYGHSQAREWVMGGASRTVLDEAALPVWTCH